MHTIVYIAVSLDGFIAKKNGSIEWLNAYSDPAGNDFGFSKFMERIDAVLMGRKTFETVLSFEGWPYKKPVFVLSRSLKELPKKATGKAEVFSGNPGDILEKLESRGIAALYVDGGETIRFFLNEDLIQELIITRIPVILGSGIPLFTENSREIRFRHLETIILPNGLVQSRYERKEAISTQ